MSRQRKKGLDYFSIDVDIFSDDKIRELRRLHGNDGYVFYNYLLARIYKTEHYELDLKVKIKDLMIRTMCSDMFITEDQFMSILKTCLEIDLFDEAAYYNHNIITSNGIKRRVQVIEDNRAKARERMKRVRGGFKSESPAEPAVDNNRKIYEMNEDEIVNNSAIHEPTADELKTLGMTLDEYYEANERLRDDYEEMMVELRSVDSEHMSEETAHQIINNFDFNKSRLIGAIVKMKMSNNIDNKVGYLIALSRRKE